MGSNLKKKLDSIVIRISRSKRICKTSIISYEFYRFVKQNLNTPWLDEEIDKKFEGMLMN